MTGSPITRTSMAIAAVSTVVEWYDFTLYLYLATVLSRVFFGGAKGSLILTLAGFALAYLLRPLGAIAFGQIGDRWGRRTMMLSSMAMVTIAMLATGLLPTYAAIGPAAGWLLLLMRCVIGFSVGGEYTGVVAYLLEGARARPARADHLFGVGGQRGRRPPGSGPFRPDRAFPSARRIGRLGLAHSLSGRRSIGSLCVGGALGHAGVAGFRAPVRHRHQAEASAALHPDPPWQGDIPLLRHLGAGIDHLLCGHHLCPGLSHFGGRADRKQFALAVGAAGAGRHSGDAAGRRC